MLHCVISNKTLTTFIVKFTNKARLHPVKVKKKLWAKPNRLCGYEKHESWAESKILPFEIFPLLDMFSRFHWLAPLERKKSSHVKKEIQRTFKDQGLPERL